jgi:hypothetical protein
MDKLNPSLKPLARGDWGRTAAIFTILTVVVIAAYTLLSIIAAFAGYADTTAVESPSSLGEIILTILLSALITPIFYSFALAVLNDLKLRKED